MAKIDHDPQIRELSRFLWEKAGRPSGREYVYWALASKQFDNENEAVGRPARSVAR